MIPQMADPPASARPQPEPTYSVTSWIEEGTVFVLTWDWLALTVDSAKEAVHAFREGDQEWSIVRDVGPHQLDVMVTEIRYDDSLSLDTVRYHVAVIDAAAGSVSFA